MLPGETIASGSRPTCDECGERPALDVYRSPAGYYIGTYCLCGPFSRESLYYKTRPIAEQALRDGGFERR